MEYENLSWSKYVAVTTDSAAAMMGKQKGATAASKKNPRIVPFYIVVYVGKHWLPKNSTLVAMTRAGIK